MAGLASRPNEIVPIAFMVLKPSQNRLENVLTMFSKYPVAVRTQDQQASILAHKVRNSHTTPYHPTGNGLWNGLIELSTTSYIHCQHRRNRIWPPVSQIQCGFSGFPWAVVDGCWWASWFTFRSIELEVVKRTARAVYTITPVDDLYKECTS